MVHSGSKCRRGVQVKLWDPLRMCAIPERLRGVTTIRRYTHPHLPYPTLPLAAGWADLWIARSWLATVHCDCLFVA